MVIKSVNGFTTIGGTALSLTGLVLMLPVGPPTPPPAVATNVRPVIVVDVTVCTVLTW